VDQWPGGDDVLSSVVCRGLYLNPLDYALVLCVVEKSRIQALNRTQPALPMGLGYVEGLTHDYVRHGTTTLYAAGNIAIGTVLMARKPRHRHREFLAFPRRPDDCIPPEIDVHPIVDNTPPTSTRKCVDGWHSGPDTGFMTQRPAHRG
jgi:hypothetical protein